MTTSQLNKLNIRRSKGKGGTGTCMGPLPSPEGFHETCWPGHEPTQATWPGHGAWVETHLSRPPAR
jgi:hypothetical protein